MRVRTTLLMAAMLVAGLLPFLPLPEDSGGGLGVFLGRFHPVLLHFPIVLLLLVIALETMGWLTKKPELQINPFWKNQLLTLTFIATFVTIIGGYLLYRSGDYQGQLVRNHLRGGVMLLLLLGISLLSYGGSLSQNSGLSKSLYRGTLWLSGLIMLFTSHIGGSITHGEDFLTEHLPRLRSLPPAPVEIKEPRDLLVFQDMIMPALEKRCLSCHNEYKTKGRLLMTSFADMQNGGKSEKPMLVAGQPAESELYHRINLPRDHDDHMPPSEKPELDEDEVALIKWWIQEGADPDLQLGDGPGDPVVQALVDRYLPKLYHAARLKMRRQEQLEETGQELKSLGQQLGLVIEPDPESTEGLFAVSMQMPPSEITDATVVELLPYAEIISKISLPGSEITDDALYTLAKMGALRHLYLPNTCIKGQGLVYLQDHRQLEVLNLSNTCLTDEGLLHLLTLRQLEKCFVYNTAVTPQVMEAVKGHLKKLQLLEEEGPFY